MSLFKKIKVETYEVQTNIYRFQSRQALLSICVIVLIFILNRYTYSKKHIETETFTANLTSLEIKRIIPANQAIEGDDQIIKIYLAKYVKYRESKLLDADVKKYPFIQALSEPNIYYMYEDREREFYEKKKDYIKSVQIDPNIKKLDVGLYQVRFKTKEMISLREQDIYHSSQVATIRFHLLKKYDEGDNRLKIRDLERLNPLKMEIVIYSTANFNFEENVK